MIATFRSEMCGSEQLGSIESLGTSVMVFCTALSPVILGWCIGQGVSMDTLAIWGAIYVFLTSALAWENYRARFDHALGVEAEGFSDGAFCPLPVPPKRAAAHPAEWGDFLPGDG